MADIAQMPFS